MLDLVQRLRDSVRACRALDRSALLAEAADELERRRLTAGEREALEAVLRLYEFARADVAVPIRAAVTAVLERMK